MVRLCRGSIFLKHYFLRKYMSIFYCSIMMILSVDLLANDNVLRDPTQPLDFVSVLSVNNKTVDLQAVFIKPKSRSAIVNGVIVKEGDRIENYVIVRINKNYIVLDGGDKKKKIHIRPVL